MNFRASLSSLKNSHLIGLMGQSNANGESNANGVYPIAADTNVYAPQVGQYIYDPAVSLWQPLQQNKNNSGAPATFTGYTGPEMKLMQLLRDYYGADQYMIKYAQGGTSIATDAGTLYNWSPSSLDTLMYKGAVANYKAAMSSFPVQKIKMKVLVWIQGEADTGTVDANAYRANFEDFISNLKNEWNLPDLKVLQTGLSNNQTAYLVNQSIVNTAKQNLSIGGNKYVSTDGAEVATDGAHFTVAGYEDVATRIFNTLITML
jgi:hypothetical protein